MRRSLGRLAAVILCIAPAPCAPGPALAAPFRTEMMGEDPLTAHPQQEDLWATYEGGEGPGKGKHIVFVTGDEEYRSEEGMPMLARILAKHHGFRTTVLFSINKSDATIDPQTLDNIPGLETLAGADLLVLFARFRRLPDEQMKHIVDYVESGKPIVALRTSTHAFAYPKESGSPYRECSWDAGGGFGKKVLGETWVAHHGAHGSESTRGVIARDHPIVRGCDDIWGPTDVYAVGKLEGATALVLGRVIRGMKPEDPPVEGPKNNPMMPIAWIKPSPRVFVTTMGASQDLQSEGLRRLLVNACYWATGMEDKIPAKADAAIVGTYDPSPFGLGKHRKGVKPAHLQERGDEKARVLILDGQNNHDYEATTAAVRATLERSGRFQVEVSRSPGPKAPKEEWEKWRPDFASCAVVVSNYNGEMWPEPVREAYVKFVRDGGGVVNIHAANNTFAGWEDYDRMIGLGWRDASYGDRLTIDDKTGAQVRTPKGEGPGGGHGKQHAFVVKAREPEHPIMKGLAAEWLHATDELYHGQRGPAADMTVLCTAYSDPATGGTGAHEPIAWVIPFGKGKVVTTVLGHHWRGQKDFDALHCVGFQTLVARCVEWAATGKVTLPMPRAFPAKERVSVVEPGKLDW